jgi:hypothetical protein
VFVTCQKNGTSKDGRFGKYSGVVGFIGGKNGCVQQSFGDFRDVSVAQWDCVQQLKSQGAMPAKKFMGSFGTEVSSA